MLSKEQVPPGFARARAAPTPLRHGELCPRRSGFPRCSGIVGLVYVEDLAEIYARAIARQTVGAEVLNVIEPGRQRRSDCGDPPASSRSGPRFRRTRRRHIRLDRRTGSGRGLSGPRNYAARGRARARLAVLSTRLIGDGTLGAAAAQKMRLIAKPGRRSRLPRRPGLANMQAA